MVCPADRLAAMWPQLTELPYHFKSHGNGPADKAMKCMTMLGDVENVLARYLQHLTFQDEQLLLKRQGV